MFHIAPTNFGNLLADRPNPPGGAGGAGGGPPCNSKNTTFKIFKKKATTSLYIVVAMWAQSQLVMKWLKLITKCSFRNILTSLCHMASYAYNGTMYEQNPRFSPSGWTFMSLPFIESLLRSYRSILLPKRRSKIVRTLRYYIVDY